MVCFYLAFLAFSIKALKSFRTGHSRNVLEVLIGYTRLLPFGENLNAIFFKAQKDEQKPESFCLFNSSANSRRWEVPDLPLCLFTFLITIMSMHKYQFCIFERKITVLVAFMITAGEGQCCPRCRSCL